MTALSSSLEHKVAIVTGGSRGLGRGIATALAARGMRVVVLARDEARLAALAAEVRGVVPVAGDVADEATAERLLREENPDLVVLCAGAAPALAPFHEQTWEQFSTNWEVDTKGTFLWLKQAIRLPMKQGGHIVVISSGAAVQGSPVSGGYAGSKRTQWFLADYATAESERASRGLRIQTLLPTLNPNTDLGRAGIAAYAARAGISIEEFARRFNPPLTPAIIGAAVVDLFAEPAQWSLPVYRVGGAGLTPLG